VVEKEASHNCQGTQRNSINFASLDKGETSNFRHVALDEGKRKGGGASFESSPMHRLIPCKEKKKKKGGGGRKRERIWQYPLLRREGSHMPGVKQAFTRPKCSDKEKEGGGKGGEV